MLARVSRVQRLDREVEVDRLVGLLAREERRRPRAPGAVGVALGQVDGAVDGADVGAEPDVGDGALVQREVVVDLHQ